MNEIERVLIHALDVHPHHNIDKAIDFKKIEELNRMVSQRWPEALVVGPGDDAAVFRFPGIDGLFVAKLESHCTPCVAKPYDGAATGAGGAMRDDTAMGARPMFLLDFIGTRPLDQEVLVGPCGFVGKCTCGKCVKMTSQERLDLIVKGLEDMCKAMDVFILGGGLSISFSDIVPAVVVAVIGKLVTEKPLTKPAKTAGDKIILIGKTGNDGNDTLFRAGLVKEMRPAEALFEEERVTMEATLAAFYSCGDRIINACSDLGAAGIGAAVCESARYGGFGAEVDLFKVPLKVHSITPEEILICETQARMALQVTPANVNVNEVMNAIRSRNGVAAVIGQITEGDKVVFKYRERIIATIPNKPSEETLESLKGG